MSDDDLSSTTWFKSSHSGTHGECVEVAWLDTGRVGVRDSKSANGPTLTFAPRAWAAFLSELRDERSPARVDSIATSVRNGTHHRGEAPPMTTPPPE
ncbi:DUF397 domain-containing protein [Nocardia rhamnosiphila]|uniref:DUF397 domain-containing protein n=1 Tax=Nocardia rhamnosiphila TaxID=426716 RepID=UPI0033DA78E9